MFLGSEASNEKPILILKPTTCMSTEFNTNTKSHDAIGGAQSVPCLGAMGKVSSTLGSNTVTTSGWTRAQPALPVGS